jgi:hypothetical protein
MAGGGTSKIVDYAIVYVPDHETDKRIIAKLKSRFEHIINHIKAVCVRYKPIAISIETKRPRMDEDGAKVQLGIWAAAYIARLAELCDGGREGLPPFLPQIVVQGYDWRLKIASANGPAEAVSCTLNFESWLSAYEDRFCMATWLLATRPLLVIFILSRQLEHLLGWVEREYVPWFVEQCLR